jgi:hypothetical protein
MPIAEEDYCADLKIVIDGTNLDFNKNSKILTLLFADVIEPTRQQTLLTGFFFISFIYIYINNTIYIYI